MVSHQVTFGDLVEDLDEDLDDDLVDTGKPIKFFLKFIEKFITHYVHVSRGCGGPLASHQGMVMFLWSQTVVAL